MTLSYYARGGSLYVRLTANKVPYRFPAKIDIPPGVAFDPKTQTFGGRGTMAVRANARLAESKNLILTMAEEHPPAHIKKMYPIKFAPEPGQQGGESLMLSAVIQSHISRGSMVSGHTYTGSSLRVCMSARNAFRDFGKDIDLAEFDLTNHINISSRKALGDRWNRFWRSFDDFLSDDMELMVNSRASYLRMINAAITTTSRENYINLPSSYRVNPEESPIVVLDPDFVKKFIRMEGQEGSHLFEFSCVALMTTLRLSDISKLKPHHFVKVGDVYHLRKRNQKTGAFTTIPMHRVVSAMVDRNISTYGEVFSRPVTPKITVELPEYFSQFPECREDVLVVRGGQEIVKPLWHYVKPHMLRKSGITTMIYDGVDIRFIKFASGHTAQSTAFERYVAHVDRYFRNSLSSYYEAI